MKKTELLVCELNLDEIRERGEEAARIQNTRDLKDADQKAAAREAKGYVESLDAKIRNLLGEVRSKTTHRDVEVIEERDIDAEMMLSIRTDTGEVIRRRQLTESELTRPLPFAVNEPGAAPSA